MTGRIIAVDSTDIKVHSSRKADEGPIWKLVKSCDYVRVGKPQTEPIWVIVYNRQ